MADDKGKVKVHPTGNFHHDGEFVRSGGEPLMMDKDRATALRAAGHVRFDDEKKEEPKLSLLQREGRPNEEPPPETNPPSPPAGEGVQKVQPAEDPAERAARKVKDDKAPNDPGAKPSDSYAPADRRAPKKT